MKKIFALMLVCLFLVGCTQTTSIEELNENPAEYAGKEVNVHGTVQNTVKLGKLSGYTLVDDEGHGVKVSSASLPAEGKEITVSGLFVQDSLFGYYIQVPDE
ncbi:MAG: hypothetical protein GY852_11650 [bacterium]|nr:hypothetical protein [bacterium]